MVRWPPYTMATCAKSSECRHAALLCRGSRNIVRIHYLTLVPLVARLSQLGEAERVGPSTLGAAQGANGSLPTAVSTGLVERLFASSKDVWAQGGTVNTQLQISLPSPSNDVGFNLLV